MSRQLITRILMVAMVLGTFALGYVCGSVTHQPAAAQGIGGILGQGGQAGGVLGAASQLGSSIVEMQQHVSGLQKNLDTLKTIQSALTGK